MNRVQTKLREITAAFILGTVASGGCKKSDSADTTASAARPATVPATLPAPTSPSSVGQTPPGAVPSTQPGRLRPGDLLQIEVEGLNGTSAPKPVRIEADGTIQLFFIGKVHLATMTTGEAQDLIAKKYDEANILKEGQVYVRRLMVGGSTGALSGPIGKFDLVRVAIFDIAGPDRESARIVRVGADGTIGLPYLPHIALTGLTASEAEDVIRKAYLDKQIVLNAMVSVLRLEAAPPDAAKFDLPDAPIYPVPDALRPVYEPALAPPLPDPKAKSR